MRRACPFAFAYRCLVFRNFLFFNDIAPVLRAPVRLEMRLELDAQVIHGNAKAFAHGMPTDTIGAELARLLDKVRRQRWHLRFP
jgi:hypothetical protein